MGESSPLRDPLRLAVGTLSRFPVRPPGRIDRVVAGRAMALAPVVGLALGVLIGLPMLVGSLPQVAPALVGVLMALLSALLTSGLHLDGLADTADGFACAAKGYGAEKALEVMHRGDVGPIGALALVLTVGVQATAAASLPAALTDATHWTGWALIASAVVASRAVLPLACRRGVAAARPDGLGATVAGSVSGVTLTVSTGFALLMMMALGAAAGAPWWLPLAQWVSALLAALVVLRRARLALGGINGDVLGATVEVALAATLTMTVITPVAVRAMV